MTELNKHHLSNIPRELAVIINPYIDHCFAGTAANCRDAIGELGILIEAVIEGGDTKLHSVYMTTQVIAAALSYEVHVDEAPKK